MFSLRARLTLLYGGLILFSSSLAVWMVFLGLHRHWIALIDRDLNLQYAALEERLVEHPGATDSDTLSELIGSYVNDQAWEFFFQIHTNTEGVVFSSNNLGGRLLPDLTMGLGTPENSALSIGEIRVSERYLGHLHVQVAVPVARYAAVEQRFVSMMLWGAPFLVLTSASLGWVLSRYSLRPLDRIFKTARKIGEEDLSERIELPSGHDELFQLACLLNDTFGRLEQSFDRGQRFVADAAHELKTPLAVVRLQTERLLSSPAISPEIEEELTDLLTSLAGLGEVIERLLILSRAESGAMSVRRESVDVRAFLDDFSEDCRLLAAEKSLKFCVELNCNGIVECDHKWLRQALLNVVVNAIRHSKVDGRILLQSELIPDIWTIRVIDEGPGVPKKQLDRLFERFFKGAGDIEAIRSSTGLGLAISKSLVELQGGTITCRNRQDRSGLVVELRFDRAPNQAKDTV